VLAFVRDPGFTFAANLASVPQPLPPHTEVLLASGPLVTDGTGGVSLPRDTAVWLAG
jgi:alpha-glucosidase